MRRLRWLVVGLVALLLVLSGCYKTGYQHFIDACPGDWTDRQKEAAYDAFLKLFFMEKQDDGTYDVDHTRVSVDDALNVVKLVLDDIDYVLSNRKWRRLFVTLGGQKEAFEREEQRWLYIQSQLGQVKVYFDFLDMLGDFVSAKDKEYQIRYLVPQNTQFDFTPDYIAKAKEAGTLKEVERAFVYVYTPYGEKVPDPATPDDSGAFVWLPKKQGFLLVSYAIGSDTPQELNSDYCEIYRAEPKGDKIVAESQPCARVFRKLAGHRLEVMVLDWDREGEPGFGVVDDVKKVYARSGYDLYDSYTSTFEKLAQGRERKEVERDYTIPELDLQIVRAGTTDEYKGDYNPDGWTVPYKYKDQWGANFNASIVYDEEDDSPYKRMKYIVKTWSDGAVWEYWEPLEEYTGDMEVIYASGRNIVYQPLGKEQVTTAVSNLCGKLYAIIYRNGDTWVKIYDADGTGVLQYKLEGVSRPSIGQSPAASGSRHIPHGI